MERIELAANSRTVVGKKTKQLRNQNIIPGVLYGHGIDAQLLQFDEKQLGRVLKTASTSLISLKVDDAPTPQLVLMRDLQQDTLTQRLLHVDFMAVRMTEVVSMTIPVVLTGELAGEGMLLTGLNEIEIQALPDNLISSIEIDISALQIGDSLYVSDLQVPEGVEILTDLEEMIVRTTYEAMEEEKEEEAELLVGLGEVKVIGREHEPADIDE